MLRAGVIVYCLVVTAVAGWFVGVAAEHRYQTQQYKQQWDQEFKQYRVAIEAELQTKAKYDALRQQFDDWKRRQRKFETAYKEWEAKFEEERKLCVGPPVQDHALLLPSADGKHWRELPSLAEDN